MSTEAVFAELKRLEERDGGLLTEVIVTEAESPSSPLHECFDWNDTTAAYQHRLEQARQLVRRYKVSFVAADDVPRAVRGFISVQRDNDPTKRMYVSTERVLTDEQKREILLQGLRRELAALRRKYGNLEEYAEILAQESGVSV